MFCSTKGISSQTKETNKNLTFAPEWQAYQHVKVVKGVYFPI